MSAYNQIHFVPTFSRIFIKPTNNLQIPLSIENAPLFAFRKSPKAFNQICTVINTSLDTAWWFLQIPQILQSFFASPHPLTTKNLLFRYPCFLRLQPKHDQTNKRTILNYCQRGSSEGIRIHFGLVFSSALSLRRNSLRGRPSLTRK